MPVESQPGLYYLQRQRLLEPGIGIHEDYDRIYNQGLRSIGWPKGEERIFARLARSNTAAVLGAALGDEGKGRFVDNKIDALSAIPGVDIVYVVRYQGGNNTGHTVENNDGIKLALHLIPSSIMHPEAIGVIDRGVVVHAEDLETEARYVEDRVGDLRGKIILSPDAILATDLERAEEVLNKGRNSNTSGGTGRGISLAYAHHYDKLGLNVFNLLNRNWRETFGNQYEQYERQFAAFGKDLAGTQVPDFYAAKMRGENKSRSVGIKGEFLDRLESARGWLLGRNMIRNTFILHRELLTDTHSGVIFEGAQALGLHPWLGTTPDATGSDTSISGILQGTGVWKTTDIADRIGIFKATFTSSVGSRRMPTHIDLANLPEDLSPDQEWGMWVREEAHEYGTTTGRPRDILHLDLAMLTYNANMAGIEGLAATHLDIANENVPVRVCTHYTDQQGITIPYQSGLRHLENVVPQYIELPGWDRNACRQAKSIEELPENAANYLAFIQARTGFPIVATTTGPKRQDLIAFPGY